MPRREFVASGYSAVWLFAMFDLPVRTPKDRKRYTRFRKVLLSEGFTMLQFSVYARYCPNEEAAKAFRRRVADRIPHAGQVRLLPVTDRQFEKMEVYRGREREQVEEAPSQLSLF